MPLTFSNWSFMIFTAMFKVKAPYMTLHQSLVPVTSPVGLGPSDPDFGLWIVGFGFMV